jgi:hypothetical protein
LKPLVSLESFKGFPPPPLEEGRAFGPMSLDAGETPALPGKDRHPKVQPKANLHFQVEKPGTNLGHVVLVGAALVAALRKGTHKRCPYGRTRYA